MLNNFDEMMDASQPAPARDPGDRLLDLLEMAFQYFGAQGGQQQIPAPPPGMGSGEDIQRAMLTDKLAASQPPPMEEPMIAEDPLMAADPMLDEGMDEGAPFPPAKGKAAPKKDSGKSEKKSDKKPEKKDDKKEKKDAPPKGK